MQMKRFLRAEFWIVLVSIISDAGMAYGNPMLTVPEHTGAKNRLALPGFGCPQPRAGLFLDAILNLS